MLSCALLLQLFEHSPQCQQGALQCFEDSLSPERCYDIAELLWALCLCNFYLSAVALLHPACVLSSFALNLAPETLWPGLVYFLMSPNVVYKRPCHYTVF